MPSAAPPIVEAGENRRDLWVRGLCLVVICGACALCLRLLWPDCPAVVLQLAAGFAFLASMAALLRVEGACASNLARGRRRAWSAAVIVAYALLGWLLLASGAPSRLPAYAGLVGACGLVLLGINDWAYRGLEATRRLGRRRIVWSGVAGTALALACAPLPSNLAQAVLWAVAVGGQLFS